MDLFLTGISHKTAAVDVRELLAFRNEELEAALDSLRSVEGVEEAVILCTCNRTEVYGISQDPKRASRAVAEWLERRAGTEILSYLYLEHGPSALVHLFRVAASLDSLVLGEPQILGQVKMAFARARRRGMAGPRLERPFSHAFRVAKKVRTETRVGENAVSIAFVAVELARWLFGDLKGRTVMLIGAGKMCELAAKHLLDSGAARFFVANRSPERARELACRLGACEGATPEIRGRCLSHRRAVAAGHEEDGPTRAARASNDVERRCSGERDPGVAPLRAPTGEARPLDDVPRLLGEVDIVLSSTAAPGFLVTKQQVAAASVVRKERPLFLIDLSVPRDIDPTVTEVPNVHAYDVDDLERVAGANREERAAEAVRACSIVEAEVLELVDAERPESSSRAIASLRRRAADLAEAEVERTWRKLAGMGLPREARESLEKMARAIVNKLLHEPTRALRAASEGDEEQDLASAAAALFGLGTDEEHAALASGEETNGWPDASRFDGDGPLEEELDSTGSARAAGSKTGGGRKGPGGTADGTGR